MDLQQFIREQIDRLNSSLPDYRTIVLNHKETKDGRESNVSDVLEKAQI